ELVPVHSVSLSNARAPFLAPRAAVGERAEKFISLERVFSKYLSGKGCKPHYKLSGDRSKIPRLGKTGYAKLGADPDPNCHRKESHSCSKIFSARSRAGRRRITRTPTSSSEASGC